MHRTAVSGFKTFTPTLRKYHKDVPKRFLATVQDVFPHKTDFPSRHIGPRKTEVVAMLDLLGYKVNILPGFCFSCAKNYILMLTATIKDIKYIHR